jgi:hypothetical protein
MRDQKLARGGRISMMRAIGSVQGGIHPPILDRGNRKYSSGEGTSCYG